MWIRNTWMKWGVAIFWAGAAVLLGMSGALAVSATPTPGIPPKKLTVGKLWNDILAHHLTYIQEGTGGPIVYDFQDPNCPYCHVMYDNEAPLIQEGRLTVRYVPVAFIAPSSLPEAAAWLQSPHPTVALMQFEQMVGNALRSGNTAHLPEVRPTAKAAKDLRTNLGIMQALGITGTPAVIYRMKSGKLGLIPGMIPRTKLATLLPRLQ